MIKYLEVPDFHFSPSWAKVSVKVGKQIAKIAREEKVDFISLPGDLFDAPIMSTDQGGINILRKIVKSWLLVCPVIAIEGTKSHDGPGCYGPLKDMGVVVLEPGHTYGQISGYSRNDIIDITHGFEGDISCVIFGVPELDKKNIIAQEDNISADEASAKVRQYFNEYLRTFMAPERLKYSSVPAICLMHGNVSDCSPENETDTILRASDIVIHTEDLRMVGIDRWSLGHIHLPWESKVICGGYSGFTGIDSSPYGKLDFIPACTLTSIDENKKVTLERKPYGTPMRQKVSSIKEIIDPTIAYWVDTKNLEEELPENAHPWSRITHKVDTKVTKRITKEQADKVKSLSDLLKLLDPLASEAACTAINSIPSFGNVKSGPKVHMELKKLRVSGCVFFHGKDLEIDFDKVPNGVTAIMGGNGEGKSSLLSFCTPYPSVVGKDTLSGRMSAIKDFFEGKDSGIYKDFLVNGIKHSHSILIQGAHTKSPRVECYLNIDGEPVLDKGTFDEMFQKCEELYGKMEDYRLINFYEQPLQSQKGNNGIMSASMVDIRNLVQSFAGIDRSNEKRYALDQVQSFTKQKEVATNWIEGASAFIGDIDIINNSIEDQKKTENNLTTEFKTIENFIGSTLNPLITELEGKKAKNDLLISLEENDKTLLSHTKQDVTNFEESMKYLKFEASKVDEIKEKIKTNDDNYKFNSQNLKLKSQVETLFSDYNRKKNGILDNISRLERDFESSKFKSHQKFVLKEDELKDRLSLVLKKWEQAKEDVVASNSKEERLYFESLNKSEKEESNLILSISDNKKRIIALNNPCPKCGYLDPEVETTINVLKDKITVDEESLKKVSELIKVFKDNPFVAKPLPEEPQEAGALRESLTDLVEEVLSEPEELTTANNELLFLIPPTHDEIPQDKPILSTAELTELQQKLADINMGDARLAEYAAKVSNAKEEIKKLESNTYDIDYSIEASLATRKLERQNKIDEMSSIKNQIVACDTKIESLHSEKLKTETQSVKILQEQKKVDGFEVEINTWDYVAKMLNSNKIPALELELLIDTIDQEANSIISPFKEQRFLFRTETQVGGVDKFAIMVNDSELGIEKNFFQFSPGEKAFLSDAYTKALIKVGDDRAKRFYSPIIMDESDGPIDPDKISTYYQMQNDFWEDSKVLVVSHSPTAHERIENKINISDLKN